MNYWVISLFVLVTLQFGCNQPETAELRTELPTAAPVQQAEVKTGGIEQGGQCLRGADEATYDDETFAISEVVGRLDVVDGDETIICSATLVHPEYIVTTTSCTRKLSADQSPFEYYLPSAMTFRPFFRWNDRSIVEIIQHDGNPRRNIALLKIDKPLGADKVRIPHLKRGGLGLSAGDTALSVAFGDWVGGDPVTIDVGKKRVGELSFAGTETRSFDDVDYTAQLFTEGPAGAMNCEGDGASPVFVQRGSTSFLAGFLTEVEVNDFTDRTTRCQSADTAAYLGASELAAWIDSKIQAADTTYVPPQRAVLSGTINSAAEVSLLLSAVVVHDSNLANSVNTAQPVTLAIDSASELFGELAAGVTVNLIAVENAGVLTIRKAIVEGYQPPDEEVISPCDGTVITVPTEEVPYL